MEFLHIIIFSLIIPLFSIISYGMYKFLSQDISGLHMYEINGPLLPR